MEINKLITTINAYWDRMNPDTKEKKDIEFIVIHYVGALNGAKANCDYFKNIERNASAHYFVDHDGSIWQSVEDKDAAWSVGGKPQNNNHHPFYQICVNLNSLNIEMCVRKADPSVQRATDQDWYFEDATVTSTIELTKMLMKK